MLSKTKIADICRLNAKTSVNSILDRCGLNMNLRNGCIRECRDDQLHRVLILLATKVCHCLHDKVGDVFSREQCHSVIVEFRGC